jgi:HEAT repeat protein
MVVKLGAETIDDVRKLLSNKNTRREIRTICCWLLGLARHQPSVPLLISAHQSRDKSLMWEAAKALANVGGTRVANIFIKELRQRGREERKIAAAWALGQIRQRKVVSALTRVLKNKGESARLRSQAAEALGCISDRRSISALLEATVDNSVEVRFWAAFALGQLGNRKALPRLKQLASSDHAHLRGWGRVSKEATLAIKQIEMLGLHKSH